MNRDDRARIIQGKVRSGGRWVSIEEKVARDREYRKRIEEGYVLFQGEWMTIEDKVARVGASRSPAQTGPQHIYYNPTINRQVYNIQSQTDARTYQQNTGGHKHLHLDPGSSPADWAQVQAQPYSEGGALPPPDGSYVSPQQRPPLIGRPDTGAPHQLPREAPEYFYGEDQTEKEPRSPSDSEGDETEDTP